MDAKVANDTSLRQNCNILPGDTSAEFIDKCTNQALLSTVASPPNVVASPGVFIMAPDTQLVPLSFKPQSTEEQIAVEIDQPSDPDFLQTAVAGADDAAGYLRNIKAQHTGDKACETSSTSRAMRVESREPMDRQSHRPAEKDRKTLTMWNLFKTATFEVSAASNILGYSQKEVLQSAQWRRRWHPSPLCQRKKLPSQPNTLTLVQLVAELRSCKAYKNVLEANQQGHQEEIAALRRQNKVCAITTR